MNLFYFDLITTTLFIGSLIYLIAERRMAPAAKRPQLLTVQLLCAVSILYIVILWKTHSLAAMCMGG